MKYYRKRIESEPTFTIAGPQGAHAAKWPGETMALVEAQREACQEARPCTVYVVDENVTLYTVSRDEHGTVWTTTGLASSPSRGTAPAV